MTTKFALVTDTTADLPSEIIEQYNLYMMPQIVIWGRESLREGIDINAPAFYERLTTAKEMPTTSRPAPGEMITLWQHAREETGADDVVVLTVSKDVSGTVSGVEEAMKEVDFPVHLVDTRTVSLALGLTVVQIAQARDEGVTPKEAADLARHLAGNSQALFTPGTLEFLHRGGRIGGASHLFGTALSIKPILTLEDGKVAPVENIRTRKRAIKRMIELAAENIDHTKPLHIGVVHANAAQEAGQIAQEIKTRFEPATLVENWLGASIGVHAGPGVLGVMTVQ
ncbi:DegV family protein [Chloroflexota bacterium]